VKLLRLQLHNFRSFADADLDLNADGLIAVVGPNGAGKSTLFAAVEWALFGGKRGTGAMAARRQDCPDGESCWVQLDFQAGGRTYQVRRVDGRDATLIDIESGQVLATTLTDTSRQAAATIGLTQEMFCGTFYARQREVHALADSSKVSERREQLERLLGIEHLRRAAELALRDANSQKTLYEALAAEAPDVEQLRADVARCEHEAQSAAPAVQQATETLERLKTESRSVRERLDALAAEAEEHGRRAVTAERAAAEIGRERAVLDSLREQLEAAQAAAAELATLVPVAARGEELAAREREMDLRRENHVRIEGLRARQREAQALAAKHADTLAELSVEDGDAAELAQQLDGAQQELERTAPALRDAASTRTSAEQRVQALTDALDRACRAARLASELEPLSGAAERLEQTRRQWESLRDERAQTAAALAHDRKHHEALAAGGPTAVCPTCRREFEDSYDDVVQQFVADIDAHEAKLATLDEQIASVRETGKTLKAQAERAQLLGAQQEALGKVGDVDELTAQLAAANAQLVAQAENEQGLDARSRQLSETILPGLRARLERARAAATRREQLQAARTQAERDAELFADQLGQAATRNGYDADAHTSLRAELDRIQAAGRRCLTLRASADSVQLLDGRVQTQTELVDRLRAEHEQLSARAQEVAVDSAEQERLRERRAVLDTELDEAQTALSAAERQATLDSQSVAEARRRLTDGQRALRLLARERAEHEHQRAVADALSAYREDASRRARPLLEEDASRLLATTTQSRYSVARLSDKYLLEVADGRELHPLHRFSGGEQDLAALCLRLALSRTLAGQRGVETGFIILDEVFGSQDHERRKLLLGQLRELADREFRQVFVISHTDDVIEHCPLRIDVAREAGEASVADGPRAG
jgi:exonuclease SbcC